MVRDVPSRALTCSSAKFNVEDERFIILDQLSEDFEVENELLDEVGDMMVLSAVSCFMRRDLNRIQGYFEITIPTYQTYEPSEFRRSLSGVNSPKLQNRKPKRFLTVDWKVAACMI